MDFLLDVWREACRHSEIGDSVASLAPHIVRALPLDRLLVRRLDLQRGWLETAAAFGPEVGGPGAAASPRTEHGAAQVQALAAWCRTGGVLHESVGERPTSPASGAQVTGAAPASPAGVAGELLPLLLPPALRGDVLAGALHDGETPLGVLLLQRDAPRTFTPQEVELMRGLLEPFAVALLNDRRLAEMARLREAVEADNRALLTRLQRDDISDSIVGAEAGLRGVMDQVKKVAPTDAPVLILGETGSGKEVIARALHERSRRASGPVVRVNCGAIPAELVDSELFGHERGSFTGAINARKGWFERADGGTLFLDEIGELPLAAQVRLLRILQDGTFERVGAQRSQTVDVRVVAATHRDLAEMVAHGGFRQDLWYRISVFPIRLPALRERLQDIAALASHFARRAGLRLGGVPLLPTPQDLARLADYAWPGNVRELAAVIERAAILGGGKRLDIGAALGAAPMPVAPAASAPTSPAARSGAASPASGAGARGETGGATDAQRPTLERAMIAHIESALAATGGRIEGPAGAAALLGINPHTLRARMRKLAVDWQRFRPA